MDYIYVFIFIVLIYQNLNDFFFFFLRSKPFHLSKNVYKNLIINHLGLEYGLHFNWAITENRMPALFMLFP